MNEVSESVEVAIKFCGGCNSTFDRVELWNRICDSAADRVSWVRLEEECCKVVLLISGCPRACPEYDLSPAIRLVSVKSQDVAPDDVVCALTEKENPSENYN